MPINIVTEGVMAMLEFTPKNPVEPVKVDKIDLISCGEMGKYQ